MSGALRIATRESEVALRRARMVQVMLSARQIDSELVLFRTTGDRKFEEWLSASGARTTFTRELEQALLKDKVDVAVHALSDMSTDPVAGLDIVAVLPRGDPRDVLVVNDMIEADSLEAMPRGSRVGTSSMRRRGLLRALHPHLEVVHLRGDLPTRVRKVDEGQVHATIVPAAALHLLEVSQHIDAFLDPATWIPTPAQGALALQIRADDSESRALLAPLDDPRTRLDTTAERALLAALEGGLQSPVGALASEEGAARTLRAVIVDALGRRLLRGERAMDDAAPELTGVRLANELRGAGASDILDEMRAAQRIAAPQPE